MPEVAEGRKVMKTETVSYKIGENFGVTCTWTKTRYGFKHEADLYAKGMRVAHAKCCYYNRTWESYEYQSVIHDAIRAYYKNEEKAEALCKLADDSIREKQPDPFRGAKALLAFGELLGNTREEKLKMKKSALSTVNGIDFPEGFDDLPIEERERRIKGAWEMLK